MRSFGDQENIEIGRLRKEALRLTCEPRCFVGGGEPIQQQAECVSGAPCAAIACVLLVIRSVAGRLRRAGAVGLENLCPTQHCIALNSSIAIGMSALNCFGSDSLTRWKRVLGPSHVEADYAQLGRGKRAEMKRRLGQ